MCIEESYENVKSETRKKFSEILKALIHKFDDMHKMVSIFGDYCARHHLNIRPDVCN